MRTLCRILLLPLDEKRLLGQSLGLLVMVRVGLWVMPFNVLERRLIGVNPVSERVIDWPAVRRIVRAVRSCSRYVPFASCLTQALAARVLLRMSGHPSDLRIGVEKGPDEKFGAHAWVEVDGRIVIGKVPSHARFAVLS